MRLVSAGPRGDVEPAQFRLGGPLGVFVREKEKRRSAGHSKARIAGFHFSFFELFLGRQLFAFPQSIRRPLYAFGREHSYIHAVRQRKRYLAVSLSQRASGPMARYFFHIREDDQIEEDPRRYRSAEHRGRPRRAAREIVAELVVQGEQIGKKRFEIVDEMGISSRFTRSPQW